ERAGRGELELVAGGAGDRVPREGRRSVEARRGSLVGAQHEAVQARRDGEPGRGGVGACRECGDSEKQRDADESHSLVFGTRRATAVPSTGEARHRTNITSE